MNTEMRYVLCSPLPPNLSPFTPASDEQDFDVPIRQTPAKLNPILRKAIGQEKNAAQDSLRQKAIVLKESVGVPALQSHGVSQPDSVGLTKGADASPSGPMQENASSRSSAEAKSSNSSSGEACEALMQQIPFGVLKEALPVSVQASIEVILKSRLPSLFVPVIQGDTSIKLKYTVPPLGEVTVRCWARTGSGEYEAYLRYFVIEGGVKLIYKQIFLFGPDRGKVYAYAKVRNDSNYFARMGELAHEFFTSKSFQSSSYIVPIELVRKRKNSALIKGLRMPWYNSEDLFAYIMKSAPGASSYKERLLLAVDIAKGLLEIHANKICHMDLKPGNIVLRKDSERLRGGICDLGRATEFGVVHAKPVSSRPYLAPEQIDLNVHVTPAMDMWSFGLILLELIHGMNANPYILAVHTIFNEKWFSDPVMFPFLKQKWLAFHADILQQLQKSRSPVDPLIEQLLNTVPEKRPTPSDVIKELERLAT
jgi:hypothetical protein